MSSLDFPFSHCIYFLHFLNESIMAFLFLLIKLNISVIHFTTMKNALDLFLKEPSCLSFLEYNFILITYLNVLLLE